MEFRLGELVTEHDEVDVHLLDFALKVLGVEAVFQNHVPRRRLLERRVELAAFIVAVHSILLQRWQGVWVDCGVNMCYEDETSSENNTTNA